MGKLVNILESALVEAISEQVTMDDEYIEDDYSDKLGSPASGRYQTDNEKASEGNDNKLDKYLRLIFKQMKKISGLDEIMTHLYSQSEHFYNYGNMQHQEFKTKVELISKIPKFLGGKNGADRHTGVALIHTFLNNGGYDRDFSKDELDLTPLVTYDVDANTVRDTTTYETGWGEVFANSEEEAIEKFTDNPEDWVSDSEHDDTDYGDYLKVSNVDVTNTNERHLDLLNLGFA